MHQNLWNYLNRSRTTTCYSDLHFTYKPAFQPTLHVGCQQKQTKVRKIAGLSTQTSGEDTKNRAHRPVRGIKHPNCLSWKSVLKYYSEIHVDNAFPATWVVTIPSTGKLFKKPNIKRKGDVTTVFCNQFSLKLHSPLKKNGVCRKRIVC